MDKKPQIAVSLARALFMEDRIEEGQLPRYERDIAVKSYLKAGTKVDEITEAEEVLVPTFEIASNPTWPRNNKNREERITQRALESISRQESIEALRIIEAALKCGDHLLTAKDVGLIPMVDAMALIEEHEVEVAAFICSPSVFRRLSLIEHKQLFIYRTKDRHSTEIGVTHGPLIRGTFFDVPIYVSAFGKRNVMYLVAHKPFLGPLVIKRDITEYPDSKQRESYSGKVFSEQLGICVINDYAVAGILFDYQRTPKGELIDLWEKSTEVLINTQFVRRPNDQTNSTS